LTWEFELDYSISGKRVSRKLVVVALSILLLAMLSVSFLSLQVFERHLTPEIEKKVTTIADIISKDFLYAFKFQIPLDEMRGVDIYLSGAIRPHKEVKYAVYVDTNGNLLFRNNSTVSAETAVDSDENISLDEELIEHFKRSASAGYSGEMTRVGDYLNLTFPVKSDKTLHGYLQLGVDADFIQDTLSKILIDVLITLFVSILITLEVLFVLMTLTVMRPVALINKLLNSGQSGDFTKYGEWQSKDELGNLIATINDVIRNLNQRYENLIARTKNISSEIGANAQQKLSDSITTIQQRYHLSNVTDLKKITEVSARDIRLPLFVYLFGTELSRSFFPIYVKELYQPIPYLSEDMVIALPMSIWVVAMIVATSLGGMAIRKLGIKKVVLGGMMVTAIGLFFTGSAFGIYDLLLWRCITAAGFGIVTVAALLHIAELSEKGRRTRSMGIYVGAMIAASVCGSSIGGILANYIGYGQTFYVAAGMVVLGSLLVMGFLEPHPEQQSTAKASSKFGWGSLARLLFRSRGGILILFSAIPTRIMLTGFLFYMTPLYLLSLGFGPSEIGRMVMCYFLVMYLVSPLGAELADKWNCHRVLLVIGGGFSAIGALIFVFSHNAWVIVVGIACIGLGQSLVTTPQLALIPSVFAPACERFGLSEVLAQFRVVERIGSIGGPLLCAALVGSFGFELTFMVISASMATFAVCLMLFFGLNKTIDLAEN
jgi:predicted MFS family arabinose efflux permease